VTQWSRQTEKWSLSPWHRSLGTQSQDMCQHLKMGLLPGAFSLLWGSAFGVTAHDAVHGAAHDAFMTFPAYTRTKEGEAPQLGSGPTPCRQSF
jgi:hypothetical protein